MHYNIADLFELVVDTVPERTAIVCGDKRLTYAELDKRANQLAHFMKSKGVEPGDHVGLHMYNHAEFIEAMVATFKIRAVPININYRYVSEELTYMFDNADLKLLFTQQDLLPQVQGALVEGLKLESVIAISDDSGHGLEGPELMKFEDAFVGHPDERDFGERSPDDLYIIYTGGTTGMPRGVMWRHEDVFFAGLQGGKPGPGEIKSPEELAKVVSSGRGMCVVPTAAFIHGAAQWAAWIGMLNGGKVVIVPGRSFDPKRTLELIEEEKVNTLLLVGDAMARPLADLMAETDYDTSSVMAVASSGAVLSDVVRDKLKALMPKAMILNNFGSTETGHQGMAMPGNDKSPDGKSKFLMDPRHSVVLDEHMQKVQPGSGKTGYLARTGRIPLGYYKDEEKTKKTFVVVDGVRYSMPGDVATVDEKGMIVVYGRGSVSINTGGEKVFPEEVEAALKAHESVMDAVVVGVPDTKWGERVTGVIQLREGYELDESGIDEVARSKVAGYKVPRKYHVVDEIARQPSGKPDYRWAKATAMAAEGISA